MPNPSGDRGQMTDYDENDLARLLEALPPAPSSWVEAAKELPRMRSESDRSEIVSRAARDARYRRAVIKAMEKTLAETTDGSQRQSLDALRERLGATDDCQQDDG